jgi:hypothetical protein
MPGCRVCGAALVDQDRIPVTFHGPVPGTPAPPVPLLTEPVDGHDVEAVLINASRAAQSVRSGSGMRLVEFDMSGRLDPVEVLTIRMRAADELDDSAIRAIDDYAIRLVRAALG